MKPLPCFLQEVGPLLIMTHQGAFISPALRTLQQCQPSFSKSLTKFFWLALCHFYLSETLNKIPKES